MKRFLVCVFLLCLVEVILICCEGCLKQEREALIALNSQFHNSLSWAKSTNIADCCQWKGVECNTTNGRVTKLKLNVEQSYVGPWQQVNYSNFIIFKDLKSLDLSWTQISNCTRIDDQALKNLEVFVWGYTNPFDNGTSILSCLDELSSLKSLSLVDSWMIEDNASSLQTFQTVLETISSKLLHLEVLDISLNNLNNEILPFLGGFRSLKELYLRSIGLDSKSDLHFQDISKLRSLEILDLSYNNLNNEILPSLKEFRSLKELHLNGNRLNSSYLHFQGLKILEILDISENNFQDTDIASALSGLSSLKSLNLQSSGITPRSIHNVSKLRSLEILDLSYNNLNSWPLDDYGIAWPSSLQVLLLKFTGLSNNIVSSLNDLPCLKSIDLRWNNLNGSLDIIDWSKLKKLEELDLSFNEFMGQLPSSFGNMTSLRELKLTDNYFIGNIGPNLKSLTSLEYLSFEENQFEFLISFSPFSNHSNLKFIYGNGNKVILDPQSTLKTWVPKFQLQVLQLSSTNQTNSIAHPNFLLYQYNLTSVDFTGCKLRGEFPNWLLENNTKLEDIRLESCSFIGDFHLPSRPHLNIKTIDVSNNAITGHMLSNNISSIFPNLVELNMSGNAIHGSIPYEVGNLNYLESLDLSNNQLTGEIPHNISRDGSQLLLLRFSNNKLRGQLPLMLSMSSPLESLLLDGNNLSGSIPSNFFNSSIIKHLDISNNNFIGKISRQIKNCDQLLELSMSNNHFEGSIPPEVAKLTRLIYLDLSQNKFVNCVPSFAKSSATIIHLSNNDLSCLSKNMFGKRFLCNNNSSCVSQNIYKESSFLVALDLSNNAITNGFHDLIHDLHYSGLNILLLKGNHFKGNIPEQLCDLTELNILDLSYNSFVGEIPSCFGKMPFQNKDPERSRTLLNGDPNRQNTSANIRYREERDNFTSKERSESYTSSILIYMSGIDLSHNKLNGSIPSELGNLTKIRSLNLSNNFFTGKIPATFPNLVQVESLDLSFNMLSGQIPPQLTGLTSLEVFSVAHNNLSGPTPDRKGQFITFDKSSYDGNQYLCGPPLLKSCNPIGQAPATLPNVLNIDEDNNSWVDMYVFIVSFVVAYTSILLVLATVLYINPYWRRAWFYYIGLVGMNCYYFIEDNLCKFF